MPVKGTMGGNAQDREDYVNVAASISQHELTTGESGMRVSRPSRYVQERKAGR